MLLSPSDFLFVVVVVVVVPASSVLRILYKEVYVGERGPQNNC